MSDDELRLAFFGVGLTLAFLGLRFALSGDFDKVKDYLRIKR
ncbi:MAG: hypothetical protein ABSA11_12685 [Candidatus Bathyarchaeia archaeon]|jgi:hypothetical protein